MRHDGEKKRMPHLLLPQGPGAGAGTQALQPVRNSQSISPPPAPYSFPFAFFPFASLPLAYPPTDVQGAARPGGLMRQRSTSEKPNLYALG